MNRPEVVARFWGELLSQSVVLDGGDAQLPPTAGMPQERTFWVNGVPTRWP